LENCLRSIERSVVDAEIIVYDDTSTDPETVAILERTATDHRVVVTGNTGAEGNKCGGLYNNMQTALDDAPDDEMICFMQDDTQMVRNLDQQDLNDVRYFFDAKPDAAFLQPAFLRGADRHRNARITRFDDDTNGYYRENSTQSVGIYFSAISIAHVGRLRACGWRYSSRERENEMQARQHFSRMGFTKNPFMMWLPSVPAYRGKIKTLALVLAERSRNCGFYPFNEMATEQVVSLRERDHQVLPVAEDFLSVNATDITVPWITHPLQGSAFFKSLNRIELKLKALLK